SDHNFYLVGVNIDTGINRTLPLPISRPEVALWSPDSHYIAFTDNTRVMIYNVETHNAQIISDHGARWTKIWSYTVPLLGWSGQTLYYLAGSDWNTTLIMAYNADDGTYRTVAEGDYNSPASIAPDMTHAFIERELPDGTSTVLEIDLRQGRATEIIKGETLMEVGWYDDGASALLRFQDSFMWIGVDGSKRYLVRYRIGALWSPDDVVVQRDKVAFRTDQRNNLRVGVLDLNTGE